MPCSRKISSAVFMPTLPRFQNGPSSIGWRGDCGLFWSAAGASFGFTEIERYFAPFFEVLTQPESQYSTPPMLMVPL
jgi:hypothetical protein